MTSLAAPFSKETALALFDLSAHSESPKHVYPAAIRDGDSLLLPNHDLKRFLDLELKTPKLNRISKHLWLAGLPRCARPLYRQRLIDRTIVITEDPNEHLVWIESRIFIKPLPGYLLDFNFWTANICSDKELHRCACGIVLSYAWLVCYQSDLAIAKEVGLIPRTVEWLPWTRFIQDFLSQVNPETFELVHDRYKFGELRLSRLNTLYRFTGLSLEHFISGYMSSSTWYKAFFSRNFAWLLAVFVYITVILSALQVGLATGRLQESSAFQKTSYGFAIVSIIAVMGTVLIILLVWLALFCYYLLSTWQYFKSVSQKRLKLLESLQKV